MDNNSYNPSNNPSRSSNRNNLTDKLIAAGVTLLCVLLLILWLRFDKISSTPFATIANNSVDCVQFEEDADMEEETFIEPEDLDNQDISDQLDTQEGAVTSNAAAQLGEPVPGPEENRKVVEPGTNPDPAPQKAQQISTNKPSPVKTQPSPATDKPRQEATSPESKIKKPGFTGSTDGKNNVKNPGTATSGSVAVSGSLAYGGRKLENSPAPKSSEVPVDSPVTVVVKVWVNEEGKTLSDSSHAPSASGGTAKINKACENAAKGAKWTPKKGAGIVSGTITYKIKPG